MADSKPVKVRAIKRGFFDGQYRLPGDEFQCRSDKLSKIWMEVLGKEKPVPLEKPKNGYEPLEIPSLLKKSVKK